MAERCKGKVKVGTEARSEGKQMKEAAWKKSRNWENMLTCLRVQFQATRRKSSRRKLRLFACGCCRAIWHLVPEQPCRRIVETCERFADAQASKQELKAEWRAAWEICGMTDVVWRGAVASALNRLANEDISVVLQAPHEIPRIGYYASQATSPKDKNEEQRKYELRLCDLLRDIFGNPFRTVPNRSSWRSQTITRLAQAIYDDRAFDRLPLLADALLDAGCDNADILDHCRAATEHVRGCWVVDLLLGKA
jgi:hypothetical protein